MDVVAQRYARALIDALPADRAEAGLGQLRALGEVLALEADARRLLLNPSVPAARREAFVERLARVFGLDGPVERIFGLLVERRRLGLLRDMADAFQTLLDERTGTVRVRVTTARPLEAARQAAIRERLGQSMGKRILMEVSDDPSLIGGIVIRMGSTVMDASLRQRLRAVEAQLVAE